MTPPQLAHVAFSLIDLGRLAAVGEYYVKQAMTQGQGVGGIAGGLVGAGGAGLAAHLLQGDAENPEEASTRKRNILMAMLAGGGLGAGAGVMGGDKVQGLLDSTGAGAGLDSAVAKIKTLFSNNPTADELSPDFGADAGLNFSGAKLPPGGGVLAPLNTQAGSFNPTAPDSVSGISAPTIGDYTSITDKGTPRGDASAPSVLQQAADKRTSRVDDPIIDSLRRATATRVSGGNGALFDAATSKVSPRK